METKSKKRVIAWERLTRDSIDVKRIYIDIAEDLVSGIVLSQIVYWHLPNDADEEKLKIRKDGHLWLVKKQTDWLKECRTSKKQASRALKHLEELGLITLAIYKFDGSPTTHIRLNWETLDKKVIFAKKYITTEEQIISHWRQINSSKTEDKKNEPCVSENPVSEKSQTSILKYAELEDESIPLVEIQITQRGSSLTENTSENTSEITTEILSLSPCEKSQGALTANPTNSESKSLSKVRRPPNADLDSLTSKDLVLEAFRDLLPYAEYAETERGSVTLESIAAFKKSCPNKKHIRANCSICKTKNCEIHRKECKCLMPQETPTHMLIMEILRVLTSNALNFNKEARFVSAFVRNLVKLKYSVPEIIYCVAWAYKRDKFKFYGMNTASIEKLMPAFRDLVRKGELKDDLSGKKMTAFDKSWANYKNDYAQNKEQIDDDIQRRLDENKERERINRAKYGW